VVKKSNPRFAVIKYKEMTHKCHFALYQNNLKTIQTNGNKKTNESKRSKKPPFPGIILPESFTPTLRFNIDSIKSPNVPNIATEAAIATH
jgi:hypothetical protein